MSSVTTTLLHSPSTAPFPAAAAATAQQTCHKCGADLSHPHLAIAEDAQARISELETQVRILTGKATAAVDKLADYEDELRQLKSTKPTTPPPPPSRPTSSAGPPVPLPSRLSNLLTSTRRTASHPDLTTPNHPQTTTSDLLHLLTQEQTLRLAAETRAAQTNDEIEELSAQLFSEANEMVASERKARRKLEERVEVLERRDREKRGRLEGLEGRLGRIERVRGLLAKAEGG